MRVNLGGLCAEALVTQSRWQMGFSADTGSIDEGDVLPAEHVWDKQPSEPCLVMTLFDLSKAFDLSVRADAWKGCWTIGSRRFDRILLGRATQRGLLHLKDKHTGQLRKRILTDMGVRQEQRGSQDSRRSHSHHI